MVIDIEIENSTIGWESHIFEFRTEPFGEFSTMIYCTIVVQTWSEGPNTGKYKVQFVEFFGWIIGRYVLGYNHAFQESAEGLNVTDVRNGRDFLKPVIKPQFSIIFKLNKIESWNPFARVMWVTLDNMGEFGQLWTIQIWKHWTIWTPLDNLENFGQFGQFGQKETIWTVTWWKENKL